MVKTVTLTRKFKYNGMDLADPNPSMTPEKVCKVYASQFPELNNAAVEGPVTKNGESVYTFARAVGAKGAMSLREKMHDRAKAKGSEKGGVAVKTDAFARALLNVVTSKAHANSVPLEMPQTAFGLFG
jgi:PRTRC genetic system protein C